MPTEIGQPPRDLFLGLAFDRMDVGGALRWICARPPAEPFAYVVTPNVDHILRLEAEPDLRPLWEDAALCLCDSRVLARLARNAGVPLTVAPGSDLTPMLLADAVRRGVRVAVVGGDDDLAADLRRRYPGLDLRLHAPPMGLASNPGARAAAVRFVLEAGAPLVLLAVGSPQQEMIAAEIVADGRATGTGVCVGASLDFITGRLIRAPRWLQRLSLEWAWRLITEPRRLGRRYLVDAPRIFPLVRRWRYEHGK